MHVTSLLNVIVKINNTLDTVLVNWKFRESNFGIVYIF